MTAEVLKEIQARTERVEAGSKTFQRTFEIPEKESPMLKHRKENAMQ